MPDTISPRVWIVKLGSCLAGAVFCAAAGLVLQVPQAIAQNESSFGFLPEEIQGTWQVEAVDFSGITAVGPEEAARFVGRRIVIGNSDLDVFGYRCRIDRYAAELIDNRVGYFGERFLFSNDLEVAGLRKAPDFYPDWLNIELVCADEGRPVIADEDAAFFCIAGDRLEGKSFGYFGADFLVTSCDGPDYILRRVED